MARPDRPIRYDRLEKVMRTTMILAAAALALAGPAAAADASLAPLDGLAACRAVADVAEKARCYDSATAALEQSVKTGELILVPRKEARAAQQSTFGFSLPALSIFDRTGESSKPLEAVTGEARRVSRDDLGHWVIQLADGAVWRQIDNEVIAPSPRVGSTIEIRRAAFGSYLMKVDGMRGVRARRSE